MRCLKNVIFQKRMKLLLQVLHEQKIMLMLKRLHILCWAMIMTDHQEMFAVESGGTLVISN